MERSVYTVVAILVFIALGIVIGETYRPISGGEVGGDAAARTKLPRERCFFFDGGER